MRANPADEEPLRIETPGLGPRRARPRAPRPSAGGRASATRPSSLLVEEASGNRELVAAAQRIRMAEAEARIAGAEQLPWLSAGVSGGRERNVLVGFPTPGGGPFTTTTSRYGVSLDLSWELDVWGRVEARKGQAEAGFVATQEDWVALAHSLIAQTAKAWFTLREARAQVDLAASTVESRRRTLDLVSERYAQGRRQALDVHIARQTLARAETALALRRGLADRARFQLETLLGRYPSGAIEATEGMPALPGPTPAGIPAAILANRPDLRAAEQDLLALRYDISASRAELLPRISLTASAGTVSNQLEDLVDGDFGVWSLFGNLVQPIFQGGRLRAQVDVSEARYREALELYANRLLLAFAEVEGALAEEQHLQRQLEAAQVVVREAGAAYDISLERYSQGTVGILELLESERSLFEARSFLIDLERQRLATRVDLHLALGGGFGDLVPPSAEETASTPTPEGHR
ncbi:MAG: efflux transporter outer membrane subunit [Planctomycetota bacterium]